MDLFKRKTSKAERELRKLLGNTEFPHVPQVAMRILQKLRDPESDFDEVAECLRWDPALVVKVLSTVNSAAYGTSVRIEDVRHAVSFLGRAHLEQLVIALAVKDCLPAGEAPGFCQERFWQAAAMRAALGRCIALELHPARSSEAFTAGLLQDMAVPVLAHAMPERYGPILEAWHDEGGVRLSDLEQEAFGWTHADVGAQLGATWELPDSLVQAIGHHHCDSSTDWDVSPAIRLVALLRETRAEHGIEAMVEEARDSYGLTPDWTRHAVEECETHARELAAMLLGS